MNRSARYNPETGILTITLGEKVTSYVVTNLDADERVAKMAFRLTKVVSLLTESVSHDVWLDKYGVHCNCGAYVFRNPEGLI